MIEGTVYYKMLVRQSVIFHSSDSKALPAASIFFQKAFLEEPHCSIRNILILQGATALTHMSISFCTYLICNQQFRGTPLSMSLYPTSIFSPFWSLFSIRYNAKTDLNNVFHEQPFPNLSS